mmetsp:Transcript_2213/g.2321  ORF Transcript_2213/g.2321 Transcript_2213/m.2321 type:complete len:529 (+) Transcript_2213:1-1587(+)
MFKQQNEEGVLLLHECSKHLEDLRESHTGTRQSNSTELLEQLEDDKRKVEAAIQQANKTKELSRLSLRQAIEAYRIEILSLSKELGRRQQAAFVKAQLARRTTNVPPTTHELQNTSATLMPTTSAMPTTLVPEQPQSTVSPPVNHTCGGSTTYSIMMDAGSTGSRTHVYKFEKNSNTGDLSLVNEVFEELKPGLSSFGENAEGAAKSLIPLMEAAVKSVPAEVAHCASVALKATAGLRLLGEEKSRAILAAVEKLIKSYPFATHGTVAEVMDGKDEGPFAWLTVNFLLGNLAAGKKTAAVLDMGGGSTQIVFQPDSATTLAHAPEAFLYTANVRGTQLRAYQHSYLGLGLKEAIRTLVTKAPEAAEDNFPCTPTGETEIAGVKLRNSIEASFERCAALVRKHVVVPHADGDKCDHVPCGFNGVYQPSLSSTFTGPIYAFSYFYDRLEAFLPESGIVTVGKYKEIGTKICGSEGEFAAKNKGTMCADFAFLYTLLHDGYGLVDETPLHVNKKINGIETAWPLGASLVSQ